jgi:hypothetical protein
MMDNAQKPSVSESCTFLYGLSFYSALNKRLGLSHVHFYCKAGTMDPGPCGVPFSYCASFECGMMKVSDEITIIC